MRSCAKGCARSSGGTRRCSWSRKPRPWPKRSKALRTRSRTSSSWTRGQAVLDAIAAVAAGRSLLDPNVTGKVLERLRRGPESEDLAFASLTDQEHKVLEQLAEGKTNRAIGEVLFLSEKTVKNYVSR